jgi:DNA-binding transcriptional regulator YdaS (Cro superfamily)
MNLTDYLQARGGLATLTCPFLHKLATRAKCAPTTLYMVARGYKTAGPKLAGRIELATGGQVARQDLRPDLFGTPAQLKKAS